jgi:hypothetical protein
MANSTIPNNAGPLTRLTLAVAALLASVGCYDDEALEKAHHDETGLVRLDEIDMGEYRVSLPYAPGDPRAGVVEFHVFGRVTRRDRDKVVSLLKLNEPELRRSVLMLVRGMSQDDLGEPRLDAFRTGVAKAANAALTEHADEKLIKNVGFYRFTLTSL